MGNLSQSGKAVWSLVTALALALSISTLRTADGTQSVPGCCLPENGVCQNVADAFDCTDTLNGTFEAQSLCADNATCEPAQIGCCQGMFDLCQENVSEVDCIFGVNGTFVADAACADPRVAVTSLIDPGTCATFTATPTATATATATATPTSTMIPDGGSCVDPSDCVSGNCVDDVCCDTACSGAGEACNVPGQVGICSAETASPAPAVSNAGMIAALIGLLAVGVFGLRLRRSDI